MIPTVELGYAYEGRGTNYAMVFPTEDDSAFFGVCVTPEGPGQLEDTDAAGAMEWMAKVASPDMVWESKHMRRGIRPGSSASRAIRGPGCVYFICDEDGYIKIGRALDPEARLAGLQTGHRQQLTLLATLTDASMESELHRRFADSRVRGEWFAPSDDLMAFIDSIAERRRLAA